MKITASIDDRELKKNLASLGPRMGAAMAKALNRTAFEIRDAEIAESQKSFTLRRLRPNFRFDGATADKLEVRFMPLPLSEKFLAQHVAGGRVTPDEGPQRLEIGGEFAVPIGAKLGARGRVPASQEPSKLLASKRAFIAKGVLFKRTGRKGKRVNEALFALVQSIRLPARFEYFKTAHRTAEKQFPIKAQQEFDKAMSRGVGGA